MRAAPLAHLLHVLLCLGQHELLIKALSTVHLEIVFDVLLSLVWIRYSLTE